MQLTLNQLFYKVLFLLFKYKVVVSIFLKYITLMQPTYTLLISLSFLKKKTLLMPILYIVDNVLFFDSLWLLIKSLKKFFVNKSIKNLCHKLLFKICCVGDILFVICL